jgi:hypothetical protein
MGPARSPLQFSLETSDRQRDLADLPARTARDVLPGLRIEGERRHFDDLVRVAKKYIDVDRLNIVVVGDRATIEQALRKTGIAPTVYLDIEGRPVPAAP